MSARFATLSALLLMATACDGGWEPTPQDYDTFSTAWSMADGGEQRLTLEYTLTTADPSPENAFTTRMYGDGTYLSGRIGVHVLDEADSPLTAENQVSLLEVPFTPADGDGQHFINETWSLPLESGTHTLHLGFSLDGNDIDVAGYVDVAVVIEDGAEEIVITSPE